MLKGRGCLCEVIEMGGVDGDVWVVGDVGEDGVGGGKDGEEVGGWEVEDGEGWEDVEGRVEVIKENGCKGGVVFKGGRGVRYVD